jgi:ABC-type phosphate/phosphonate transport system substrate-binding protein
VYLEGEGEAAIPRRAGWGDHAVHIITHTRPIPSDVIATRKSVPELVRRMVQSALVEVQNAELQQAARALLGAEGFIAPTDEHLEPLTELLSGLKGAGATPHSFFPPPPPPRDED